MSGRNTVPVYGVYSWGGGPALALGMVTAYAKRYGDGALDSRYAFVPAVVKSLDEARLSYDSHGPGVVMCSNYVWVDKPNLEILKFAKERHPHCVTVAGGPNVPNHEEPCRRFLDEHPYVDVTVRGEGEITAAELLEHLVDEVGCGRPADLDCLAAVQGLTYRRRPAAGASEVVRTADRPRIVDLDSLPSPYLTGIFDGERVDQWDSVILETNRGCPYGCTFCDWGSATLSKIREFSLERVCQEIEWAAERKVKGIWIADANFGILKRDVEIAQAIARCRERYGFPTRIVVNYAKQATERLAEIVGLLRAADVSANGIIAIQTRDPATLANVKRSNIKTSKYEELIKIFRKEDLPLSSDLMLGLPGATVESCKEDFQFFFDREVNVKAYNTMVLPNSPMAQPNYIKQFKIELDRKGRIRSTYSFTRADMFVMRQLNLYYQIFVSHSILKYLLLYLQADHGVKALAVLHDLSAAVNGGSERLSLTRQLVEPLTTAADFRPALRATTSEEWSAWFGEVAAFVTRQYGIAAPAMATMLRVQQHLLPGTDRLMPETLSLPHDVVAYFAELRRIGMETAAEHGLPPLAGYGPGVLEITDPFGMCDVTGRRHLDRHRVEWELDSPLQLARGRHHAGPPPEPPVPLNYLGSAHVSGI